MAGLAAVVGSSLAAGTGVGYIAYQHTKAKDGDASALRRHPGLTTAVGAGSTVAGGMAMLAGITRGFDEFRSGPAAVAMYLGGLALAGGGIGALSGGINGLLHHGKAPGSGGSSDTVCVATPDGKLCGTPVRG